MGRYTGKTCRLLTMLVLTASFFLVEIVVGYVTNSIALVADSFHMLSDVVALIVGFSSVRIAKWPTKRNTFGWARAEVLGAMVNAVFLLALCFSIFVEALKRLVEVEKVEDPKLLLIVGVVGLVINLIGLGLFHQHGHSHGGGGHGHSHGPSSENEALVHVVQVGAVGEITELDGDNIESQQLSKKAASSAQLNMRGVFLHVMGDALGSVIVIVSALVIWFVEASWKYYIDPAMSIGLVIIILSTTIPLFRESALILMQTVPGHIHMGYLKKKLEEVEGVLAIHEFHVWQLAGSRIIASAHVRCRTMQEYVDIAFKIKEVLHNEGIHSTTIQPECEELYGCAANSISLVNGMLPNSMCYLECPNKTCHKDTCCGGASATKNRSRHRHSKQVPISALSPDQLGPVLDSNLRSENSCEGSRAGSSSSSSECIVAMAENGAEGECAAASPSESSPRSCSPSTCKVADPTESSVAPFGCEGPRFHGEEATKASPGDQSGSCPSRASPTARASGLDSVNRSLNDGQKLGLSGEKPAASCDEVLKIGSSENSSDN